LKLSFESLSFKAYPGFQTTYEELKLSHFAVKYRGIAGFQTTYEELKQGFGTIGSAVWDGASRLPMRN